MILYLTDHKDYIKINIFSNVVGYKTNIQASTTFLFTNNEQVEKEIRQTIPLIIALEK
jgi:hypothetical protein